MMMMATMVVMGGDDDDDAVDDDVDNGEMGKTMAMAMMLGMVMMVMTGR